MTAMCEICNDAKGSLYHIDEDTVIVVCPSCMEWPGIDDGAVARVDNLLEELTR